jgi:hypothetical protein
VDSLCVSVCIPCVNFITQGICKESTGKNKDTQGILRHTRKTECSMCLSFPYVSQFPCVSLFFPFVFLQIPCVCREYVTRNPL